MSAPSAQTLLCHEPKHSDGQTMLGLEARPPRSWRGSLTTHCTRHARAPGVSARSSHVRAPRVLRGSDRG